MRAARSGVIALACLALSGVTAGAVSGAPPDHAADPAERASERTKDTPARPVLEGYDKVGSWHLAWHDEFDGDSIDDASWTHEVNCWGGGNNERQCYTDRADNSFVEDGLLHIVAKEETFTGPALQDDDPGYPGGERTQDYTSARLRTKGKVDFTYGRVDVRAKIPGGQGMWPAIWMLPTDNVYGSWPASGEIDIMEAVNLATDDFAGWGDTVHGTLHYGLQWPQWENHGQSLDLAENPADDFHTYSLEWDADEIRWYIDGVHWQTQSAASWYNYIWGGQDTGFHTPSDRAPFDEDFHLLLNLAVGGDWPGNPDSGWDADREMLVDYVRVYECPGTADGTRCAMVDPDVTLNTGINGPGVNTYDIYSDGVSTLTFDVDGVGTVTNTPVPGSFAFPGVTVTSDPAGPDGWDIDFSQTGNLDWGAFVGNVFLTAEDMGGVAGVDNGLNLAGGSGWTNYGELEFMMKVDSIDPSTKLYVKMDSGYPKVGFVEITPPALGEWTPVSVKVADLLANWNPWEQPLVASNINNLFVLEATGPADLAIDDMQLSCAYNLEPEDWQIDKTCELAPRLPIAADEEIDIDNVVIAPVGAFANGDFADGLTGWTNWIGNGGVAAIDVVDGAAKIAVDERGAATWSIQFFQTYDIEPGDYTVSFDARSTVDRTIEVTFEDSNYVRHMTLAPQLTGEWQTFTGTFTWPLDGEGSEPGNGLGSIKFLVGSEP